MKVLIVDDAGFIRHLLSKILMDLGCLIVGEARNGTEAVQMAKDRKPDLIFMDLVLPEKNGVEAAREIRETNPHQLIAAMSTVDDVRIINQALKAGCFEFLEKPFNHDRVSNVIERVRSLQIGVQYG